MDQSKKFQKLLKLKWANTNNTNPPKIYKNIYTNKFIAYKLPSFSFTFQAEKTNKGASTYPKDQKYCKDHQNTGKTKE